AGASRQRPRQVAVESGAIARGRAGHCASRPCPAAWPVVIEDIVVNPGASRQRAITSAMVDRRLIATAAGALAERAVAAAHGLTQDGHAIDDHQVVVERVAYAATEARVIAELAALPDVDVGLGRELGEIAACAAAELAAAIPHRLAPVAPLLGLAADALGYDA